MSGDIFLQRQLFYDVKQSCPPKGVHAGMLEISIGEVGRRSSPNEALSSFLC